ncbi:Mismatch repair protein msh3, partial [Coemansia erecta]
MGPAKRVQASLSSFFKVKAQTKDEDTGRKKDENTELGSADKQADKRKRRRTVDSDDEYLSSHSTSSDDKAAKLHKGTGGRAQSKGHTLVKSVSDTADLMQRLRMRAKEKEGGIQPTPEIKHSLLATSGTVEGTHVQLVERAPGIKYTPLEMQVLDAKRAHPDMLLAVEVGYKFRFFGEDARIASRVLGIMCTMANNFYNASVPTPRLMIHVQRLVHAGYKVGVLRQVETAALKAVSDNKGAPFTRELSEVFTTGTMVDAVDASAPNERFLMCVVERLIDAADKRVSMAMLAVQVTTGSVVYDEFEDGYLRGALETRLAHLQPGELLVPPGLSAETLRTLTAYAGYPIDTSERPEPLLEHANRTSVRVAFANAELLEPSMARSLATDFYATNDAALLPSVLELPEAVVVALALMLDYLRPFKLDRALLAAPLFLPFHTQTHMLLSATALQTLSVFTVGAAGSDSDDAVQLKELLKPGGRPGGVRSSGDGSLFGVMDFTRTQFGRRLLRRWVAHPLISKDSLTDRTDAVEYLKNVLNDADSIEDPNRRTIAGMHGKLAQLVDLERGLCRIHYAQAGPQELLRILRSLETAIALVPPGFDLTEPRLLADVLGADTWSTDLRDSINAWRSQIDYASAKRGHRETLFTHGALFDHVQTHHDAVASVENELQEHRAEVSRELGDPAFEFKSVSGIDYLIDVRNARAKTVPASWIKVSGTKTHSRFHTPFIAERLRERDRCRESLQKAARDAYARFLREISEKYAALRRVIVALATLDALFSLAVLARQAGYSRPELIDSPEASVDLAGAVNPILGPQSAEFVANDI